MFTSPHPSSPWATLDRAALFYAASPVSSYGSDDEAAVAFPTPAQKPALSRKVDEVDYFSFRPHGIRSPYLPENYGQIDQEGVFDFDDDARSEASSFSSTSTAVDDWAGSPEHGLGAVFEEDDDDDELTAFTPVYIERVRSFSSSASSSSASSIQTPSPVTAHHAKVPAAPRKRHSTAFALKVVGQPHRQNSFESVALAQWTETDGKGGARPDTPYPFIAESPDGAAATLFNWRRE
jgi:hypothetical protein